MSTHGYGGISVSGTFAAAGAAMEDFPALPLGFAPWFQSVRIEDQQRDVTTFLTRFTVEFPVANGRLFPYLTGGGGVDRVTERFSIVVDPISWIPLDPLGVGPVEHPSDGINTVRFFDSSIFPSPVQYSELGLELRLGRRRRCAVVARTRGPRGCPLAADPLQLRRLRHRSGDLAGELSVLIWRDSLHACRLLALGLDEISPDSIRIMAAASNSITRS